MENHPTTLTWDECGKMCNADQNCSYWTWLGGQGGDAYKNKCLLKASAKGRRSITGAVSGNRDCTTQGKFNLFEVKCYTLRGCEKQYTTH